MMEWITAALAGAITGVLSGFGIGGGSLLLIYMTSFAGVEQNLAQGINLLYFLPTAATALPAHMKNGYIEKAALLPAILAGFGGLGGHCNGGRDAAQMLWGLSPGDRSTGIVPQIGRRSLCSPIRPAPGPAHQ